MADEAVANAIGQVFANLQKQIAELESAANETRGALAGGGDIVKKMPALIRLHSASAAVSASIYGALQLAGGSAPVSGVAAAAPASAAAPSIPREVEPPPAPPPVAAAPPPPPPPPAPAAAPPPAAAPSGAVDISSLPADVQKIHKKAARFSRVAVQEFLLYKKDEAEAGRRNKDLYRRFKEEIDKTKEQYDEKFKEIAAHNVDYFYEELVRTLANNDASALEGYPR